MAKHGSNHTIRRGKSIGAVRGARADCRSRRGTARNSGRIVNRYLPAYRSYGKTWVKSYHPARKIDRGGPRCAGGLPPPWPKTTKSGAIRPFVRPPWHLLSVT